MATRNAKPSLKVACRRIEAKVTCQVHESFRVAQVAGMFDVPIAARASETFNVELPALDELIADHERVPRPWQIGVIVGPSGSGKSTIAREAFGERLYSGSDWPADRAVIDCFPEAVSIRDVTALLTSVGFSTPPAWIKPYHVLSNGERFRCDLARALIAGSSPVVFDEFTSVVDRTVAKTGSVAVSKHVRRTAQGGPPGLQFVAVTCHYDIVPWLEPDWVLDMASCQLARGRLRRPQLNVEIFRTGRAAWQLFKKTHYLSGTIPGGCRLYVARVEGQPAALVVTAGMIGTRGRTRMMRRISRLVVLPDYQGIGLGGRVLDAVAELLAGEGFEVSIKSGHPSMVAMLRRATRWRITKVYRGDNPRTGFKGERIGTSRGRFVVRAVFLAEQAQAAG